MIYDPHSQFENRSIFKTSHQSGFTLIEAMICIAFLAIVTALAVPSFETLAYGSASNRAVLELISDLELTRMKAIRTSQQWSVVFNDPAANQYSIYDGSGAITPTKTVDLDAKLGRLVFDNIPAGGAVAPDPFFVFTSQGFIRPSGGAVTGNIYITDNANGRRFCISTTASGGIVERRWDGAVWSGPQLEYVEP